MCIVNVFRMCTYHNDCYQLPQLILLLHDETFGKEIIYDTHKDVVMLR